MNIGKKHWLLALTVAVLCQALLVVALYPPVRGAPQSGERHLDITLSGVSRASAPESKTAAATSGPETAHTVRGQSIANETLAAAGRRPRPAQALPGPDSNGRTDGATKERAKRSKKRKPDTLARVNNIPISGDSLPIPPQGRGIGKLSPELPEPNAYYQTISSWLERHKRYPQRAIKRRLQGTVRLTFTIDRDGNLLSQQITASSGHPLLDREADAMLRRAAPLPALPQAFSASELEISLPIRFALR